MRLKSSGPNQLGNPVQNPVQKGASGPTCHVEISNLVFPCETFFLSPSQLIAWPCWLYFLINSTSWWIDMDWLEWLESMRILMGLNSPCVCHATKTPVCWVESFKKRPHRDQARSAGSFFDSQTRRAQAPSAVVDTAARVASWWLTCVGAVVAAMAKMDGAGRFQQQAKTPAANSMKIVWIHKLSDCQMWSSSEKKQCQIIYTLALYSRITTLIQAATAIPSLVDRIHILGLEPKI